MLFNIASIGAIGVQGLSLENIKIFPNPARDLVTLSLDQAMGEEATITIFNTNGQLMQQIQYNTIENTTEEISIDKLPAGTYFVHVRTNTTQQSLRLVKQ
ncbi:MAG: T9SS type A sorting domain-containing protein [Bacteroidota bacterium]